MTIPTTNPATPELRFESPDGRIWARDVDHLSTPRSPMAQAMFERAFSSGLTTTFERLGAPLARAEACHVEGWCFLRMVPAGAPDKPGASGPPPAIVLRLLSRLHPELRRREKIARRALDGQVWMDDVEAWWRERPRWEAAFGGHQEVDLTSLDDSALADQVDQVGRDAEAMLTRHFELVTPGAGIGLAILACARHGIGAHETADALRGCSASTSAPVRLLDEIATALGSPTAVSGRSVDDLRAASPEVGELVDEYLSSYGWRVFGDDLTEPTLAETPELLTSALAARASVTRAADDPIAQLVERVPADERDDLASLLRQAGRACEMLDDNSAVVCWGFGCLRRVALEAAHRLSSSGRLDDPEQVFMLEPTEVAGLLRGARSPDRSAIAERHRAFIAAHVADAPLHLGGEPSPPPDTELFPRGLATIAEAVGAYLASRFPSPTASADTGRVEVAGATVGTGHGVGGSRATGRAVVAHTVEDAFARLEPGDVLVCPVTNPAYNVVFPIAAAVVTAVGGPFSHAAVTAREVGIPAVVGIGDLSVIEDGDEVTVIG